MTARATADASPARVRLPPDARRRQLLDVAAAHLTHHGVDGLQMSELAIAAGVTRPVVYRFFPNRRAVLVALMEDFEATLNERFEAHGVPTVSGGLDDIIATFVDTVCDTIEARGAGTWHLLGSRGPDPELAAAGQATLQRIVASWHGPIATLTGAEGEEVVTAAHMLLAAGRAALDRWLEGRLTRDEAVRDAARGIRGILLAFSG